MRYPLYTLTVITGAYPMPPAYGAPPGDVHLWGTLYTPLQSSQVRTPCPLHVAHPWRCPLMRYPLYTLTVITGAYPMSPACGAPQDFEEMPTHEVPFIHPNCHHITISSRSQTQMLKGPALNVRPITPECIRHKPSVKRAPEWSGPVIAYKWWGHNDNLLKWGFTVWPSLDPTPLNPSPGLRLNFGPLTQF